MSFRPVAETRTGAGFMRDAPLLLVLDEPTAALDAETEHALLRALRSGGAWERWRGEGQDRQGRQEGAERTHHDPGVPPFQLRFAWPT